MSSLVLLDAKFFAAGRDFSGQSKALALEYGCDMKDATTFGNTTRINAGGLKSVVANMQGLWDASTVNAPDPAIFENIGVPDLPVVMSPTGVVGDTAFLFRAVHSEYSPGAPVGDLLEYSATMEGAGGQPLVRGKILEDHRTASGNYFGPAVELGAVGALQFLYATLQVFSGTGAFTIAIESDADAGFGSPTTRYTFAQVAGGTPVASEWAVRVAGPITDTWWRIAATNPATRGFAVAAGIQ